MTTTADPPASVRHRIVAIGTEVLGGTRLPVLAGPRHGADMVHISLRRRHGLPGAADELAQVRDLTAGPLLVEPFSADDLPAVVRFGDGIVVRGEWMQDFRLLAAVGRTGLPVVLHRGAHCSIEEWLSSVEYVRAEGNDAVVLCEGGSRTYGGGRTTLDLALVSEVRDRSARPVLVDVGDTPWLAGGAVAAGADGVWLNEEAEPTDVAAAMEYRCHLDAGRATGQTAIASRLSRSDRPRRCRVRRAARVPGRTGQRNPAAQTRQRTCRRDRAREAEIVRTMAHRVPSLDRAGLTRIMDAVITAGLDAAETAHEPVLWRL